MKGVCEKTDQGAKETAFSNLLNGFAQGCCYKAKQYCKPESQAWCDDKLDKSRQLLSTIDAESQKLLQDCSNNAKKIEDNLQSACDALCDKIKQGPPATAS